MVLQKITQHYDSRLSKEVARIALKENPVVVSYYTNETNTHSVVHSHSYHELVYNVSGSNVLYSIDGSQYMLRKGDVIFFPVRTFPQRNFQCHGQSFGSACRSSGRKTLE